MLRPNIAYPVTEFDYCSCSRAHQNLNGSRDLTTPFQGCFVIHGLALATINHTPNLKSMTTRYEDINYERR